ncbi:hypothetical protein [Parvibaculum sp. MBR-TMA-1.3b-4.2]|jgi:hypothetical protein
MMNAGPMTLERLDELLSAYGADEAGWPAGERQAARDLIAASAEARQLLEDARALDTLLNAAPVEEPSAELVERLMAARPREVSKELPQARREAGRAKKGGGLRGIAAALWPYGSSAFPAGALAASLVLGIALGTSTGISPIATNGGATTTAAATADSTDDQLIAIALADPSYIEEWTQ